MKVSWVALFIMILQTAMCWAEGMVNVENENDRISYSVGYQVGGDFKSQGLELNPDAFLKGIEDAISEHQSLLTAKEMRTTLVDLKKKIVADQAEQSELIAQRNFEEGKTFLEKNRKEVGVVTLPSGLQYEVIEAGEGDPPKPDDTVTVHYRGMLIDGTEFDSSYHRQEPATFQANRVIKGWKEALQIMKPGAKYKLFIPPELAYGERGGGSKIGPNSTLVFEVELLSVNGNNKLSQ